MRRKRGLLTTIIRGVPSTSHESMKNEEGLTNIPSTSQHRWGFAWSFVLSLWRSRFPTPGAPWSGGWASCGRFGWRWRDLPPWFQNGRWRSFAVMYDGMWRSLLTTYPRPFVVGWGKVLRSEQVGGGVRINIFSVMYEYIFCLSKAIISKVSQYLLFSKNKPCQPPFRQGVAKPSQPPGNLPNILIPTYTNHSILSWNFMLKLPVSHCVTP